MYGSRNHYVKKNRLESERQLLCAFCHMWNLHVYMTPKKKGDYLDGGRRLEGEVIREFMGEEKYPFSFI